MPKDWRRYLSVFLFSGICCGCTAPLLSSYVVYENPTSFIRLEPSPWADLDVPETWNAHPASLSRHQIHQALQGLRVREHRVAFLKWILGPAPMEPVFRQEEVDLLLPRLMEGLEKAIPQELVTFYLSHPVNATKREVTSGGLYVTEGQLHIILSNYRAVYGIPPAGLIYDRRYPLFSLGPLGVEILYEAKEQELVFAETENLFDAIFGDERSGEIVLDLSQLSTITM